MDAGRPFKELAAFLVEIVKLAASTTPKMPTLNPKPLTPKP